MWWYRGAFRWLCVGFGWVGWWEPLQLSCMRASDTLYSLLCHFCRVSLCTAWHVATCFYSCRRPPTHTHFDALDSMLGCHVSVTHQTAVPSFDMLPWFCDSMQIHWLGGMYWAHLVAAAGATRNVEHVACGRLLIHIPASYSAWWDAIMRSSCSVAIFDIIPWFCG